MRDPISLRERVASLRVEACGLTHEQVIFDKGQARRVSRGVGVEPALRRVGLCSDEHRAGQLSCAHTTARYVLGDAVLALHERGAVSDDEARELRAEIESVSDSIHQTDWSKGEAEARYALMRERGAGTAASMPDEMELRIAELIERHGRCVERLQHLREHILRSLDVSRFSGAIGPETHVWRPLLDEGDAAGRQG
ncbi:MAG: hypothetical protein ACREMV_06740 [Gemmatimonadales bacterium]